MKHSGLPVFAYPAWGKAFGTVLILGGTGIFLYRVYAFQITDFAGGSFPVAMGLMFIFFAKERDSDERTIYLKFKSLMTAIPVAAVFTMLINYAVNATHYSIETDSWFSISAFEYLTIAMLLALACYFYLKGRE